MTQAVDLILPLIEQWRVLGENRICGIAYRREGHADGGTIVTTPVESVHRAVDGTPIAVTHSKSHYRLGLPSNGEYARAAVFLRNMLAEERPTEPAPLYIQDNERTRIIPPEEIERIVLDATSFAPLKL